MLWCKINITKRLESQVIAERRVSLCDHNYTSKSFRQPIKYTSSNFLVISIKKYNDFFSIIFHFSIYLNNLNL